jgi:hypothetical protein
MENHATRGGLAGPTICVTAEVQIVSAQPKLKPCPICGSNYFQASSLRPGCSLECRKEIERQRERKRIAKEARKETRVALVKLRTVSDWTKLAQCEFNRYIRLRDEFLPCISCGRSTGSKRNAGHYLSTGAHPELRFHEDNCHSQCEHCNSWKSGNAVDYRVALIRKIGLERVEALEGPHEPKRYRVEELVGIRDIYRAKVKHLKWLRESKA